MFRLLPALLLATAIHLVRGSSASAAAPNIVDLEYVKYRGNLTFPNAVAYLGIPYAEPPLGDRRFRNPVPLDTHRIGQEAGGKVVDASVYPDFCVQGTTGGGDAGGAGSEDCLKINVYAPAGAKPSDKLPVLVYIHGGGYIFGNPRNWPFDHWIHQSPNVVIVSVYYRLDSLGFLATPEFNNPAIGDFNPGFQDQTQALKLFGGNPRKVTINGQSAGGGSVELHLVANGQEGLFSGGIAQSVYRTPTPTPQQMQPLFDFFSEHAGCGTGSTVQKVACLREASVSAIARAQDLASTSAFNGSYKLFHPVVDGKIITRAPTLSLLNGQFAKVPVIVGSTSNETEGESGSVSQAMSTLYPMLSEKDLAEFERVYSLDGFTSQEQQVGTATGESTFRCGRSALGNAFGATTKAWTYRYNQPNPTQNTPAVLHAAENCNFNGTTTFTPMTPTEIAFAEELIAYWLSFVRSEDPNTFKLERSPEWKQFFPTGQAALQRMVLQQGPGTTTDVSGSFMEHEPSVETERCAFVISKAGPEQD
ncbi:alpha/beta-hydrolase [Dendrothele bispora CBS 962.96]|uniref:Carboxylic ester hydrolase n=1 Tax=Dendrothele bispora (strain CBS 962.96) TaxID=1314807 RepID=A0A4S8L6G0_DENBC|nr:alpha/beta-hydrolase [Dendrothele bispora CBS 962.96]